MGCLGGVPVHHGQIVDHAMPTGFRYKLWLLAASMSEWREAVPDKSRHCLEFDFEYSVKFEAKLTPFEVEDMEHEMTIEVGTAPIWQSCKSIKHPGPVPRQSIFCLVQPGTYSLTFYAEYPLGGWT
ncbi:unnamed protein product [Durusdinium trenchii]|uniref:Uncharacterized protein n=2 Tax=Durusdinium trenchii TaxID=1381693 RepID=A0ABP0RDQ1_9DINO